MPRLQNVFFDLDGTLLDSAPDITQAVNRMLAEEGRPALTKQDVIGMIGDGSMALCRRALDKTGGVPEGEIFPYVQRFIEYYRSLPPDPAQIYPKAREVLETLRDAGVKLAVCTNKSEASTLAILRALDLLRYFDFVAGGDTFPVHKPNPEHVTGIFKALGTGPEGTLFIGDGPNDSLVSQKAGIPCFIVTHGYGVDYSQLKADKFLSGLDELLPAIKDYGFTL